MYEVRQTPVFRKWLRRLKDSNAVERILARIVRVGYGLLGDVKPVGGGVSELRIDYGPGYRLYFTMRGGAIVLLLCGGTKDGQADDIERAKALARWE